MTNRDTGTDSTMADAKARSKAQDQGTGGEKLHRYRSHTCGALRASDIGNGVRLSGWVHRVRDHGGLLFIDLRDHYGITQIVADPVPRRLHDAESIRPEWVIRVEGTVVARAEGAR